MPPNPQNLIKPKRDRTAEERRKSASRAGKASGKARREKKTMQEMARMVLDMGLREGEIEEALYASDLVQRDKDGKPIEGSNGKPIPKNLTIEQLSLLAIANKAKGGDIAALTFLRDTAGEKPVERVEVSTDVSKAEAEIRAMLDEMVDE